jgi:hypothetical protein
MGKGGFQETFGFNSNLFSASFCGYYLLSTKVNLSLWVIFFHLIGVMCDRPAIQDKRFFDDLMQQVFCHAVFVFPKI